MKRESIENLEVYCGLQEKHTDSSTMNLPVYVSTNNHLAQKRAIVDDKGTHETGYVHKLSVKNATIVRMNEEVMILFTGEISIEEVVSVAVFEDSIVRIERTVL